jgi:hypothetical protein
MARAPKADPSLASLTFKDLLLTLKPSQAWAAIAALLTLLAGTFVVGTRWEARSTARVGQMDAELSDASHREQFYQLYARVLVEMLQDFSRSECFSVSSRTESAANLLADFITPIWRSQQDGAVSGKFDLGTKMVVSKGFDGINDSHFHLAGQRGSWPIPGMVKSRVLQASQR